MSSEILKLCVDFGSLKMRVVHFEMSFNIETLILWRDKYHLGGQSYLIVNFSALFTWSLIMAVNHLGSLLSWVVHFLCICPQTATCSQKYCFKPTCLLVLSLAGLFFYPLTIHSDYRSNNFSNNQITKYCNYH